MSKIKIHSGAEAKGRRTLHAPKLCFVGSSHLITKFEGGRREETDGERGGGRAVKNAPPPATATGAISTGIHTRMDTNGGEQLNHALELQL